MSKRGRVGKVGTKGSMCKKQAGQGKGLCKYAIVPCGAYDDLYTMSLWSSQKVTYDALPFDAHVFVTAYLLPL